MTLVKICGVSTRPALDAALAGGAAFVGFMFHEASPRYIAPAAAAALADAARGKAQIVAVAADPDDALLDVIARVVRPDLLQLHGEETPARARAAARRADAGVIKALPVASAADLDAAAAYDGSVEHLMFDAKASPDADRPGGHGVAFDWRILAGREFAQPWFLAGGLTPANVAAAIAASGAPIVDVSSGVEGTGGLKDPALIARFLEAVASAEPRP